MHNQPKYKPLRPSTFFADGRASRPPVEDTVAREHLNDTAPSHTGKAGNAYLRAIPLRITEELVREGQTRFNAFCSPCHDRTGSGNGMIVQRGYRQPPSLHIDRLRQVPDGYLFDVMTTGFGVMPSYKQQIPVQHRWAIVAYVRALQLAQAATLADVSAAGRAQLEGER